MRLKHKYGIIFLYNGEYGVSTDENGLYYMRARYYNPEIKRFINQDVLIGTIADSPSMNRYAYVHGNPISLADPFGLSPQTNWLGHAALDVLGLIPGVGFVFDIANAAWYFEEGDTFGWITSLISAVPGVGDALGGALKLGKCNKAANIVKYGSKVIGNSGRIIKGSYVVGNVLADNYQRYVVDKEKFSLAQLGVDALTMTLEVFSIKGATKGLKSSYSDFKVSAAELGISPKLKGSLYIGDLGGGKSNTLGGTKTMNLSSQAKIYVKWSVNWI